MDPGISVPPPLYGGHERLVEMFANAYHNLGHEVSLLAGPDSKIKGTTYSFGINDLKRSKWQRFKEVLFAWRFLKKRAGNFDLIHNFGRLAYLLPIINNPVHKIMTYGRQVDSKNIFYINKLPHKNLKFTAPSYDCISTAKNIGDWTRVFNAIDFSKYTLTTEVSEDSPLMFLSRLDRVKGCHVAIAVARAANIKLIIAGNISNLESEIVYFKNEIEPFVDGEQIIYVGAVNDEQKNHYLGKSKALLFPIDVREAFGMVMAESMACGTPVIAFGCGAVKEVIDEGITGFVVENETEMLNTLPKIKSLNRKICRETAEKKYDTTIITNEYLTLFRND